jgi:hypothetical protein
MRATTLSSMSLYAWTLVPLFLLHLWLAWRHRAIFRFQILLDVVLAAVVGPTLVIGGDLNPVSTIKGRPPFRHVEWSVGTGYQPTQGDLVYQFHPWWEETGRQLRRGELPRIQSGVGAGLPLLANGQTGVWAPMMLPVWLHGPERGTTIMAFWRIELAGLGAFLLMLRVWRLRWAAASMGGIAWAGTPYLVGWLLVPLAWTVAALPWVWWAAWWLMRRRAPGWAPVAVGAGFGWLMGAGLHPETAAIVCGSALLSALILHPRRWRRPVVVVMVAGVVSITLAWPTIAYIGASSRVALGEDGAANRERMPWSMQRDLVRQIAVPASMGRPGTKDWRPSYPHAPGAAGVGGAVLALLAVGRIRRHWRRLAVSAGVVTALGLVLLIRIPPLDTLLVRIPPLDHMTVPRFGVLIPWGVVVLAALALDGAFRGHMWSTPIRLVPAAMVAAFALAAAPWQLLPADTALVIVSVAAAIMIGFLRRAKFAPALVAGELALLAVGINPTASVADRVPRPPVLERLVELEAADPCRVIGIDGTLAPNLGSRYGLRDLRASDPLRPEPFARLLGVLGEPPTILGGPLRRAPAGLCGAWGVGLAVTKPDRTLPGWHREYGDRDGVIWSNPQLLAELRVVGRVIPEPDDPQTLVEFAEVVDFKTTALVGDGAQEVHATVMSLEVWRRTPTGVEATAECDGPCLVIVAQPWAPGWQGDVDGRRVDLVRTDIAGMGVVVPAGRHHLRLTYHPWRW